MKIHKGIASAFLIFTFFSLGGCHTKSKNESPKTLHIAADEKIKGFDPIYADDRYSAMQSAQVYEALFQYHYLKRPYVLIPNLAESMPEVSADGRNVKIHIKQGVLFQDDPCFKDTQGKGRELTAEDVVYSFKRLADPKLVAAGWWILEGKVLGLDEWRALTSKQGGQIPTDYSKEVEGLKTLDRYTLQIKLHRKSSQLFYLLAMPFAGVVPKEAVEAYGKEFINHAVGTGPFKLVEFVSNAKVIWEKNPTYRKELYPSSGSPGDKEAGLLADAGKVLPLADRIVVDVFVERQPMWLNFLAGKLDFSSIPKDNFGTAITPTGELMTDLKEKGMTLLKSPGMDVTHTSFNMDDPLLGKNKLLRQAMSLAVDARTWIELFHNGRAIPAQGPIPPGLDGYDSNFKNPYRQFNLVKAKELLAKAGFPNGNGLPALEYAALAGSLGRQAAEFFQKEMQDLGVSIQVNFYSWPQFLQALQERKGQLWSYAWSADYPDTENFLQLFYSKNGPPGPNDSNYSNPIYDHLYEQSLTLSHSSERTAIYKQMQAILVEDCPWIFEAHRVSYALIQKWLKNYKPTDFEKNIYKYYRIEPTLKK